MLPKDGGNVAGGQPVIADLNLDGLADLAVTSIAFDMVALIRVPGGGFQLVVKPYPSLGSFIPITVAVGDLNCDGCPDVLGSQSGPRARVHRCRLRSRHEVNRIR